MSTDPRPVRRRRGELLRPRREPARRLGAHAGARRRLLHRAVHGRRLPRHGRPREARRAPRGVPRRGARGRRRGPRRLLSIGGTRPVDDFHSELGEPPLGGVRDGAVEGEPRRARSTRIPQLERGVLAGPADHRHRRGAEPGAREGGPRRRLLRARASSCAATRSSANESAGAHFRVEYQTPDGEAPRDDARVRVRRGVGVARAGERARAAQGAARVRERPPRSSGATSEGRVRIFLEIWRQRSAAGPRAASSRTRCRTSPSTCRSSRCSTSSTAGSSSRARSPSRSTRDCREGICGHVRLPRERRARTGRSPNATICQTHMRHFHDGDALRLEPWRAAAFPVLRDLCVDRSALDRIIAAGGLRLDPDRERAGGERDPRAEAATRTARWRPPPASAAAPASRPARTPPRRSSPARR